MRKIWVTFRSKGIHRYSAAETDPALKDQRYLAHDHRHLFYFRVAIQVWHDDREIEFHQFQNWIESLYGDRVLQLDHLSCEMMCDQLHSKIAERYTGRFVQIEISEDSECGAEIDYPSNTGDLSAA